MKKKEERGMRETQDNVWEGGKKQVREVVGALGQLSQTWKCTRGWTRAANPYIKLLQPITSISALESRIARTADDGVPAAGVAAESGHQTQPAITSSAKSMGGVGVLSPRCGSLRVSGQDRVG
jgi:hypothetical protein